MPTYEYLCEGCSHAWETFQSMKDDPVRECPSCHEQKARRQISAGTGFILKGGGGGSTPEQIAPTTSMGREERMMRERFQQVSGIPATGED